jgi:ureidoacrylate peracid hydrolase
MIYDLAHGNVALLVIDVQREYFDEEGPAFVEHATDIVANINRLIDAFRRRDHRVVFMKHAHRPDGSDAGRMGDFSGPDEEDSFVEGTPRAELIAALHRGPDDVEVVKRRYSSFLGTDLEAILRTAGARAVAICGLMTSFCCETTARDAHGRDYEVLFVADAVEGPDLEDP